MFFVYAEYMDVYYRTWRASVGDSIGETFFSLLEDGTQSGSGHKA